MGSGDGHKTKDGRLFHGGYWREEKEWPLMLECIKREDLNVDERFSTRPARASNSLELLKILDNEFVKFNWKDLENLFKDSGVTFGPISEPNDHINDTQIR